MKYTSNKSIKAALSNKEINRIYKNAKLFLANATLNGKPYNFLNITPILVSQRYASGDMYKSYSKENNPFKTPIDNVKVTLQYMQHTYGGKHLFYGTKYWNSDENTDD